MLVMSCEGLAVDGRGVCEGDEGVDVFDTEVVDKEAK
jgi:hypothetical protein